MAISCDLVRKFIEHDWPQESLTEEFAGALGEILDHLERCSSCSSELTTKFEDLLVKPGVEEAQDALLKTQDAEFEQDFGPDWKKLFRDLESKNK